MTMTVKCNWHNIDYINHTKTTFKPLPVLGMETALQKKRRIFMKPAICILPDWYQLVTDAAVIGRMLYDASVKHTL